MGMQLPMDGSGMMSPNNLASPTMGQMPNMGGQPMGGMGQQMPPMGHPMGMGQQMGGMGMMPNMGQMQMNPVGSGVGWVSCVYVCKCFI